MELETANTITRRNMLIGGGASGLVFFASGWLQSAHASKHAPARSIALNNLHTGEKCCVTYFERGHYDSQALAEINHLLRDHRTDQVHAMDKNLIDLLFKLNKNLETSKPFEIISGYRSPASNATLRDEGRGVAKRSLHMEGKAVDIRLENRSIQAIHAAAKTLGKGGVGYYPSSQFVHVDTGKVRYW